MRQEHGHDHGHDHGQGHSHGHDDSHGHDHGDGHHHHDGWRARLKHVLIPHSHDANESIQSAEEAVGHGIRAAWIGLVGMMLTAAAQVVIVAISGSVALLADTVHNLGHAATTIPLLIAFRWARRPPTEKYSYGYRRAEDLVGVFIALIIALSAALIIWESVRALMNPRELDNLSWVFAAGLVGALGNEVVAIYRIRAGRRIGSAALIAEGQHARADGLTSIAVVLGVVGVWLGYPRVDAFVGLLIALVILGILISTLTTVLRRLMDGVEPDIIRRITAVSAGVDEVHQVGRVRARWCGHRLEADIEVSVGGDLSVLEGHQVAEKVHHTLLHEVAHLDHVAVHVHPVVDDRERPELHALIAHHASPAAHDRTGRARERAQRGHGAPATERTGSHQHHRGHGPSTRQSGGSTHSR